MNRRPSAHASGRILLSRRELLAASAAAPLVACRSESALKEPAGGSGAAVTTRGGRTREVKKIVDAQPTVEGAGVRLLRVPPMAISKIGASRSPSTEDGDRSEATSSLGVCFGSYL